MNSNSFKTLLSKPDLLAEIEREWARRHLREFVRQAWPVLEPEAFVPGWHVDAICEHLEAVTDGYIRNLLITIPPRHTKSTLISVIWPCWEWINHPENRFLCSSYAETLAIRDAVRSRRLIQSPWYQANWGAVYHLSGDQNVKARYENDRGGFRLSAGAVSPEAIREGLKRVSAALRSI